MPEHQQIQQSKKKNIIFQKQAAPISQTPASNPYSIIQRAKINPKSLTHADVMQLQRTIGNRAVAQLLSSIVNSSTDREAPIQRSEIPEEEEPLKGKMMQTIQRQEIPEEEESLQGKMEEDVQRQEISEKEETCPSCIQRHEIPEEEETLQGKMIGTIQRQETPDEEEPLQVKRENNTGIPDNLKSGVENLSGIDMSDVRVHYNSDKPSEVGALAYTQGVNIHVAPGQEKHLPHEAWHVVQQAQGRVKPTGEVGGMRLNDSRTLESEADSMGRKALQQYAQVEKPKEDKSNRVEGESKQFVDNRNKPPTFKDLRPATQKKPYANNSDFFIQRKPLNSGVLNVAGEHHDTSDEFRTWEGEYTREKTGGSYWQEDEFKINVPKLGGEAGETVSVFGDPKILQMANVIQFNTKALLYITKFLTRLQEVKATRFNLCLSRIRVFGSFDLINMHLPRLKAWGGLYKKVKPQAQAEITDIHDFNKICEFYIEFGDEFYDVFVAGIDQWVTDTKTLNRNKANEIELNNTVKAGIFLVPTGKKLINKMFKKEDVSDQENQARLERVIFRRSKAMHEAGTKGKALKGVWKIGNQHVKDIKEEILKDAKAEYELMTEDEFLADFNKWLAGNIDYRLFVDSHKARSYDFQNASDLKKNS